MRGKNLKCAYIIGVIGLIGIIIIILINKHSKKYEDMYSNTPKFISSSKFVGSKKGYVFRTDSNFKKLGYYIDINKYK